MGYVWELHVLPQKPVPRPRGRCVSCRCPSPGPATLRAWRGGAFPGPCLPPSSLTSASACSRQLRLILLVKYCRVPFPAATVSVDPALGRRLCTGVVSVCFGSVWQCGIHFGISRKLIFTHRFCQGKKHYLENVRLLELGSDIYCLIC